MRYSGNVILLSIISIAAGSILLPYSKITHSEIPATALLLVFLLRMLSGENLDMKNGNIYGLISSALILLKPGNVIYSGCIIAWGFYLIIRRRFTPAGIATLLSWPAAAVLIMAGLNIYRLETSSIRLRSEQSVIHHTASQVRGLLFSPSKYFSHFHHRYLMHPVNLPCWKKSLILRYGASDVPGQPSFLFKRHDWHGGWCWGPRLFLPPLS
jgi:hypothetical protein